MSNKKELFKLALECSENEVGPVVSGKRKLATGHLYTLGGKVLGIIEKFKENNLFNDDDALIEIMDQNIKKLDNGTEIQVIEALKSFKNYIDSVKSSLRKKTSRGSISITVDPIVLSAGERKKIANWLKVIVNTVFPIKGIKYENSVGVGFIINVDNLDFMAEILKTYSQDEADENLPARVYFIMETEPFLEE